ncbi:hypothetical protein AKJ65_03290 [candidate division MSBL1 archaeon SCGC-AAA259E19]|uniref:Uncharacterized protein n=1 Tax=candidate division MSBL1 archaeon SCGC-AAA259E19 TaxID=1698264 RepID=A0A133UKT3_9EURY|nr:hypothetical protein AKJ65_03290 [candidate division MSBL1 archaeon SCGC-AAA259E19]
MSGTWQFTVNWNTNEVTGSTSGGIEADISGSVSEGKIDAEGTAATGTVTLQGEFSKDGASISGTWSGLGDSGKWTGRRSIAEEERTEEGTATEGDTGLPIYPKASRYDAPPEMEQEVNLPGELYEFHSTDASVSDVGDWYDLFMSGEDGPGWPARRRKGDDGALTAIGPVELLKDTSGSEGLDPSQTFIMLVRGSWSDYQDMAPAAEGESSLGGAGAGAKSER